MIPAYARPAHRRLRQKLADLAEWGETCPLNRVEPGSKSLGIVTSGISFMHAREAAPEASVLKLGLTHPLPLKRIAEFVKTIERCVVLEEGDPYLVEAIRAAGLLVEGKADMYRFGELDVPRVHVVEPRVGSDAFDRVLIESLNGNELTVIIARRPCILIAKELRLYEQRDRSCECDVASTATSSEPDRQPASAPP
jgi:TPP-dependent indolepyruvate ferredoxin oxidoreductase alpha subunit